MQKYKSDFPILNRIINGKLLVYFDNAATSQMPLFVFEKMKEFEFNRRANVHRGVHTLSEEASVMYEQARKTVSDFILANDPSEIVFVRNATEAINLAAYAWGRKNINKNDIILTSEVEHHSNLIPWQILAKEKECTLTFIPVNEEGKLDFQKIHPDWFKVKLVAIGHAFNVLGTINDITKIVKNIKKECKKSGSKSPRFLVDGAQSVPHIPVNVKKFGIDFFAFSGHKMCGPMGIGVLWVNRNIFGEMSEFLTGGGMIDRVSLLESGFAKPPERFEAGTPNVTGAVGLAAACEYLTGIGMENIRKHEVELTSYALRKLRGLKNVTIYGPAKAEDRTGLISFNINGIHPHDAASILDSEGIAVRSGQHCVMPWHVNNKINATIRASFYLYNTADEVDRLISGLEKSVKMLI